MSRTVVAVKVVTILSFVFLTNRFLDLGNRVATLVHNFDGYRGVLIFGGLWVVCLAGMLATGFLPRLWLRVVFAAPLLAGALVGTAYEDVARSEIDYDQVLMLRESISHMRPAVLLYVGSVFGAAVLTLLGAAGLLLPLRTVRSAVPAAGSLRRRVRALLPSGVTMSARRLRVLLPAAVATVPLRRHLRVLLPAVVAAMPFVVLPAVIVARGGYGVGGLPVQHKAPSLFLVVEIAERLADVERKPVDLALAGEAPAPPHVVLVIDDGVRGDYLDLNVERGTTPALLRYRDRIANFGHAVSAANCSPASNLVLRTGAMPADLVDGAQTNPYVWSYARRAGMRTVYIHPPRSPAERAQRMAAEERGQIDQLITQRGDAPLARDRHAVEVLGGLLARSDPQFIMVMKSGIHFPYEVVSPGDRLPFLPPPDWEQPPIAGTSPRDSYENAIEWNVDRFFEHLFANVTLDDAVLLYTSDHGQNLPDDGGQMPECSTGNTSPLEGLVPMLAITGRPDWRSRFEPAAARNLNRASHFNVFPTLLVLFGYDREQIAGRFEPSLLDPIEAEHGFTTGLVTPSPRLVVGPRTRLPMHRIPREILDRGERLQ